MAIMDAAEAPFDILDGDASIGFMSYVILGAAANSTPAADSGMPRRRAHFTLFELGVISLHQCSSSSNCRSGIAASLSSLEAIAHIGHHFVILCFISLLSRSFSAFFDWLISPFH